MRVLWCLVAVAVLLVGCAPQSAAQNCPDESKWEAQGTSTLHGIVVYHDELRQWLGLRLDKQTCGEDEIEIVFTEPNNWRAAEALRECKVTLIGTLFYTPTGYYSAVMGVTDPIVAPDVTCKPLAVKPDLSLAPKKENINKFVAELLVDYRNSGRVRVRVWENEQKKSELTPWEPYMHYMLTGARDVVWFGCADGFEITDIKQKPKPKDGWFHDEPNVAGTVLPSETVNTVTFTCERERPKPKSKR